MELEELRKKDVIQAVSGDNLGQADDLQFDAVSGSVQALVLHGRPRFFGLLGREPDLLIPWQQIKCIGTDVVMTTCEPGPEHKTRRKRHRGLTDIV